MRAALQEPCRGVPVAEILLGHARAPALITTSAQRLHPVRPAREARHGLCSPVNSFTLSLSEGVVYVELGAGVFHHRHHRRDLRLYRHSRRCGGNREDPVRRVRGPFPGLAGRGLAEKALTNGVVMQLKLLSIAAAVALAIGTTAAGVAQAQSTPATPSDKPTGGARADGGKDHKPSGDRKARKGEHDKAKADIKAKYASNERRKASTGSSASTTK